MQRTLAQQILSGRRCLYCDEPTKLVDSIALYGRDYGGMYYRCEGCNAHVGTHKGTEVALGTVANADLRKLRHAAHGVFDPLWRARVRRRCGPHKARDKGYKWLSDMLGIPKELTHIGMFDEQICEQVIRICRPYYERICNKNGQPI